MKSTITNEGGSQNNLTEDTFKRKGRSAPGATIATNISIMQKYESTFLPFKEIICAVGMPSPAELIVTTLTGISTLLLTLNLWVAIEAPDTNMPFPAPM